MEPASEDPPSRVPVPPSIISERMTDIVSEDGDEYYPEGAAGAQNRAPKGHSAANSSRPSSPPTTSHSYRGFAKRRGQQAFGGPGLSMTNSSRQSGGSSNSRESASHAPSITSRAFFRPMSSQRLQAQRSARSMAAAAGEAAPRLSSSTANRPSLESNRTATPRRPGTAVPPSSRGTDFTEQRGDPRDREFYNASPTEHQTVPSVGESQSPLQPSNGHARGNDEGKQHDEAERRTSTSQFRSTFLRLSKNSSTAPVHTDLAKHERQSNETMSPHLHEKGPVDGAPDSGKNHEYFTGNTIFCWGGRLQNTRERPINIFTGMMVVLPTVLYFVFAAPWLWYNISPALPIVYGYIFFICFSSFLHASFTDPGVGIGPSTGAFHVANHEKILPRNLHPLPPFEGSDDPLTVAPPLMNWTMIKAWGKKIALMDVPTKYCKTCNIWRPPRCHHCRVCDNCIDTQDHHCVWLNNCVGRRNYRYFFTFVAAGTVLGLYLTFSSLALCLVYASAQSLTFVQAIDVFRVPFALFIFGVLVTPYPACLTGYHLFLTGRGETTREFLNSHNLLKRDRHRPFDRWNVFANWKVTFLKPKPPMNLRFKERYTEGDPRFGPRKGKRQAPLSAAQQGGGMELRSIGVGRTPANAS